MKPWQEECEYFGRHTQLVPAEFAYGYQYRGPASCQAAPPGGYPPIQAEGHVRAYSPFDHPAPQVEMWFETEKKKGFRLKRIRKKGERGW